MLSWFQKSKPDPKVYDALKVEAALSQVRGVAWFDPDGIILNANDLFLSMYGYTLEELKGKHHRTLVSKRRQDTTKYKAFLEKMNKGILQEDDFARIDKNGNQIWVKASYNPILNDAGELTRILSIAVDVTEAKDQAIDAAGQVQAISKAQAVIEFSTKGIIQGANENFLACVGYTQEEIIGQHHRLFVEEAYAKSTAYQEFWEDLANGKLKTGEYKRFAKGGREVWLQACYNPIFDDNGDLIKVVKFATDITTEKREATDASGRIAAISKAQGVIDFDLEGNILAANDKYLSMLGYSLEELRGKNQSVTMSPDDLKTPEYQSLWSGLRKGETHSGEFKHLTKSGQSVWLQASYSSIVTEEGKPFKVVKYAVDITDTKQATEALVQGLNALANGDLSARLPQNIGVEFEGLRDAFNGTLIRLEELVSGILEASESIATETTSIAENANDLSTRGEKQAATVEETAAAMEEISSTVTNTVENARIATKAAEKASDHAQKGGKIVTDAVDAMSRIEASTLEISKIVEVIDGIAFQTNLLALNAGVEAARAGDAGRGFAVVASEVRALAHRSSESAREINELITKSNTEVSEGSELVNNSGQALTKIVSGVVAVVDNINEILNASQEQASGVTEVTAAIGEIDRTTQHTASLAGESAMAATHLAERAANLRELVSFFGHGSKTTDVKASVVETKPIIATEVEAAPPKEPAKRTANAKPSQGSAPTIKSDADGWEEF